MTSRHAENFGHLDGSLRDADAGVPLPHTLTAHSKGAASARPHAAKWLAQCEDGVQYWRCGITIPPLNACTRLATVLDLDLH